MRAGRLHHHDVQPFLAPRATQRRDLYVPLAGWAGTVRVRELLPHPSRRLPAVRISPFGPERSLPRRPPGVDMARIFRQAILGVSVPAGVISVLGFLNRPRRTSRAFCAGLGATALALAVMWGYSWLFESRHPDASREFWRLQEAKMRPRMFVGFSLGLLIGAAIIAVALRSGD